jgi:hypothetical protein
MRATRLRFVTAVPLLTSLVAATARPGAARAAPTPPPEEPALAGARLRLLATQPDVTWLLKKGRRDLLPRFTVGPVSQITIHTFEEMCAAPCEAQLPPGDYIFGLTQADSRILQSTRLTLRGDETLTGTWVSRRPARIATAFTGLAALLAGFIVASKKHESCSTGCSTTHPYVYLGLGIAVAGAGLIVASQFLDDRADIEVSR